MDDLCIKGISIEVVPSYRPDATEGAGVGYIITIGGKRIYYAGFTGFIPEMQTISADVMFPIVDCTLIQNKPQNRAHDLSPNHHS